MFLDPTERQRTAKAQFWQRYEKNPILGDAEKLSGPEISRLSGHQTIYSQLKEDPDMWSWFFDKDYATTVLKSGLELAVQSLIEVCTAPLSKQITASTKVRAAEILMKFGGLAPEKGEKDQYRDEEIANMGPDELERYVEDNVAKLKTAKNVKKSG